MPETPMTAEPPPRESLPPEPITATIVPPTASPWQFGMKAMLGVIAVSCLQFSVMYYVGVFGGFIIGMSLCIFAFAVMMLAAVFLARSRSPLLDHLDFYGIRLVMAIAILFLGTLFAGGGTAAYYIASEMQLALTLETSLGMRTRSIQVADKNGLHNALLIMTVSSGGVADRAGLRRGEVIYFDETQSDFYRRLEESRGKDVDVNVAIGASTASLDVCAKRSVTLSIPP